MTDDSAKNYGLLARFETASALVAAARALRGTGGVEGYAPYPVAGLSEALGEGARWVPWVALAAAVLAAVAAYFMQWYSAVIDYPFVVGGKPLHSWPAFMLVTFACLILAAVLGAVLAMLAGNRLPEPYHPVFNVPAFARASDDGFFLLVTGGEADAVRRKLTELGAAEVVEVPK